MVKIVAIRPQRPGLVRLILVGLLLVVAAPHRVRGQTPLTFVAVSLDADTRRADRKLQRYLEPTASVVFVSELANEYGTVIDRLSTWKPGQENYIARVTPYALVAAELLGADLQVIATYVSRATGNTTYRSYFVVQRRLFPYTPDLGNVPPFLRNTQQPRSFIYHNEFSTSSYFLPALYFRQHAVYDMALSTEQATAIHARQFGTGTGSSADLVRAVAEGRADFAAVWDGTKATFEGTDSLEARYGSKVYFIPDPTVLPNDLLVAPAALDSTTVVRVREAIERMGDDEINEGDFLTWRDLSDAPVAREALANLRQLAREPPAPSIVQVRRASGSGSSIPDEYLQAARQAIRLAGSEMVNYDPDFHAQLDYVWTLEPLHDGAIVLRSRIVGSDIADQEFPLSFRDAEDLTRRIGEVLRTRLHRIRYVWPYRKSPPTVLRDVDFTLPVGAAVRVRAITWLDLRRNDYLQGQEFGADVVHADFYKFELAPDFIEANDRGAFGFSPMSNLSYRVVLPRTAHERPMFRVLTVVLVILVLGAGVAGAVELRRVIRDREFRALP
jgi:ABC-type phosphate/phosphonate transport system substrate-binding protein